MNTIQALKRRNPTIRDNMNALVRICDLREVGKKNDLKIGDKLEFTFGDKSVELELAGSFKDAVLGSDMMGMFRFMMNDADYNTLRESNMYNDYSGCLLYIKTNNIPEMI